MTDLQLYLLVPLAPLAGAIAAGLFGRRIGRAGAHWAAIVGVAISFAASCLVFADVLNGTVFNGPVYTWLVSGGTRFEIGFLIDRLSALMMVVVSFVSLMVHVYTVGYMADDPGYQRFFAYTALFTFSMLMLVMANNFLQLFFGWEAVGLVSYLLIGFWYTRPSAIYANLKAFLVNRVGDFGFLIGVALVLAYFGTLDYAAVFSRAPAMAQAAIEVIPGAPWLLVSAICIGLFVGAMGKSAQFPLHVWLPDSMEGPTPISALIHAATMVTAAIFHLMTHAFFKALLFLGAGSVIIALHHEQDMRKMGGLWKHMPWTYGTVLVGAIASAGVPGFAGFFSKDAIIEAVHLSMTPFAGFAWLAVTLCAFVTAFYTFRLVFYAFHGEERFDTHGHGHVHESPAVVTVPLVLLAIPSICAGWLIGPVLFGDYFGNSLVVSPSHPGVREMAAEFQGVVPMMLHAVNTLPFWLSVAGIAAAWYLYILKPGLPGRLRQKAGVLVTILEEKYGFDRFYDWFFAAGVRRFGNSLWRYGDVIVIDGLVVNGSARLVGWFSGAVRLIQSGFIYHYAFSMIIGVFVLLTFFGMALLH